MEIRDTANLLAKAALVDNRQVSPQVVAAWHEAIGHHNFHDALAALDLHRQTSSDYLVPAHINDLVPLVRRNREAVDNKLRALTAAPPKAIEGPPEWFNNGRPRTKPKPPEIECPWCKASPGRPCTIRGTTTPIRFPHPSRLEATGEPR